MTLTEAFAKNNIFIDFDAEIIYGSDEAYDEYPAHFPTVDFQLVPTNGLSEIADRIRKDLGFAPMHPMDEYTDETCDNEGWYDFYIGLNGYNDFHVDGCICFAVVNSDAEDNEEWYMIDLTGCEQRCIYNRLDELCRQHIGKSCEEMLQKAEMEMNKYCS